MARKTYYYNQEFKSSAFDHGQTAAIRFNAEVDVYDFSGMPQKFVLVNLQGSTVTAAENDQMAYDRDDKRGYYTDWVEVSFGLSGNSFYREQDSPGTTMGSAATSSTTAISVNAGAGSFGPVPTTSVGGGVTIGSSFSKNLSDFKIVNKSTNNQAIHRYALSASSGAPYSKPNDLLDMSVGGQFTGACLFQLPDLAVANLAIISQAIFISSNRVGDPVPADPTLLISIKHHVMQVEKTFELVVVDVKTWSNEWSESLTEPVSLNTAA